jgi:flagellar basal-body rod modification protein FlgD
MGGSVTPNNAASALGLLSSTPATTQVGTNANNAQMNQFLTLLVAQLQNQDPMQPTDPTQFVAQLAQFSTVEQLVQSNTTLTGISQNLSSLALGQYSALINHTVTAAATTVTAPTSGTPQTLSYNVSATGLANVHVQITDASGRVVNSLPVTGCSGTVVFNGLDGNGNQLPAGQYNVALVGTSTAAATVGQSQSAGTLTSSGTVASVQQGTGGAWQLQLADGRLVSASTVSSVQ